jgi:hypothetical protein
MMVD